MTQRPGYRSSDPKAGFIEKQADAQDGDDIAMYEWNGTILGPPHSAYENRIFSLSIYCGDRYPGECPLRSNDPAHLLADRSNDVPANLQMCPLW